MLDFSIPSAQKKIRNVNQTSFLPTADKSPLKYESEDQIDRTMDKDYYRSPVKSNKISEAKRSINEVINILSDKKRATAQGIEQVKLVNNQLINSLSCFNPNKQSLFADQRYKTAENAKSFESNQYVTTSQFEWKPKQISYKDHKSNQDVHIHEENIDLRKRLNEELKKNNDLLKYITSLEAENSYLKSSQVNNTSSYVQNILDQNKYLRSQISQSQAGSPSMYNHLLSEMQKLKEENHQLRKNTIALLKKQQY